MDKQTGRAEPAALSAASIMVKEGFAPYDIIVGIGTGGWVPAAYVAAAQVKMHPQPLVPVLSNICYSSVRGNGHRKDGIFGGIPQQGDSAILSAEMRARIVYLLQFNYRTEAEIRILVVDDIADTGNTIKETASYVRTAVEGLLAEPRFRGNETKLVVDTAVFYATPEAARAVKYHARLAPAGVYVTFDWE